MGARLDRGQDKPPAAATRSRPRFGNGSAETRSGKAPIRPAILELGCQALAAALAFAAPADVVLRRFFREHPKLGRRDRGLIAETTFGVLRRLRWFAELTGARDPRRLFILGMHERQITERYTIQASITAEEAAWLTEVAARDIEKAPLGIRADLPDWIIDCMRHQFSAEEVLALGMGMQSPAPLDLRVNTVLASREDALTALACSGVAAAATPYSPIGIRMQGKPALEQHALYQSGKVEVQDEGSQLLGFLLAPRRRQMVVDFCAGAGGKTLMLGALMRSGGRIYAFDVSPQRIQRLRTRVARSGLSNVQAELLTHENDNRLKRLAGKIDRILVDAPCTGFGTLRRNPDLKWRQQPADLAALRGKQARILCAAARLLKPGGRLVYATCSFLPQENDSIVDDFLASHTDMVALDCEQVLAQQGIAIDCGPRLRLLPHRHGTDGFFAAAFEKAEPRSRSR